MKEWHFFDKVFRRWLVVFIGDYDEFIEEMKRAEYTDMENIRYGKGMCIQLLPENSIQNAYVIWMPQYESSGLVHEIAHLVGMVFDDLGIPISRENTETFAFYSEYWWTEINKTRRKFPSGRRAQEVKK